jgi:hypothetical protein
MRRIKITKTKLAAFGAAAGLLASGVGVFAYFIGQGTGSAQGNFSVGAPALGTWTIETPYLHTGGPLTPGGDYALYAFDVTNNTSQPMQLNAVTATVTADAAGGVFDTISGKNVDSCKASWFTATLDTDGVPLPLVIPAGASLSGYPLNPYIEVALVDSGTNQSACENLAPQFTINAS